jgi:hypothetical protein
MPPIIYFYKEGREGVKQSYLYLNTENSISGGKKTFTLVPHPKERACASMQPDVCSLFRNWLQYYSKGRHPHKAMLRLTLCFVLGNREFKHGSANQQT